MHFDFAFNIAVRGWMMIVNVDFDIRFFQKGCELAYAAGLSGIHQNQLFYLIEINVIHIHHVE